MSSSGADADADTVPETVAWKAITSDTIVSITSALGQSHRNPVTHSSAFNPDYQPVSSLLYSRIPNESRSSGEAREKVSHFD